MSEKYVKLCHAMQSGVAMKMNYDSSDTSPKHLRVGVNSALVDNAALARLLMKKGIITEQEYFESLEVAMAEEVARYEKWLNEYMNHIQVGMKPTKITLG